jgi:hypothetical protein
MKNHSLNIGAITLTTLMLLMAQVSFAHKSFETDSTIAASVDTAINITLRDVTVFQFRNPDDEKEYYLSLSRIRKVLPYVKMAKQLYVDVSDKKENEKKKDYRHYRKDLEKEMRDKFEKELRDLTIGQGKVLVKLINRETGNNCYEIIKDVKGGFSAFAWQIVARHYDYNLKEKYDPKKEWILEMAIRTLGAEYSVR